MCGFQTINFIADSYFIVLIGVFTVVSLLYSLVVTHYKYKALKIEVRDTENWVKFNLTKGDAAQGFKLKLNDNTEELSPRVIYLCRTIIQQQTEINQLRKEGAQKLIEPHKQTDEHADVVIGNVQELSSTLKTMTGLLNIYQRVDAISDRTYILSQMTACTDQLNSYFNKLNRSVQNSLAIHVYDLFTLAPELTEWVNGHVYGDRCFKFSILNHSLLRRALAEVGSHYVVYGLSSSLLIGLSHTERTWSMSLLPNNFSDPKPYVVTEVIHSIQDLIFRLGGTVEHVVDHTGRLELIKFAFELPQGK